MRIPPPAAVGVLIPAALPVVPARRAIGRVIATAPAAATTRVGRLLGAALARLAVGVVVVAVASARCAGRPLATAAAAG